MTLVVAQARLYADGQDGRQDPEKRPPRLQGMQSAKMLGEPNGSVRSGAAATGSE